MTYASVSQTLFTNNAIIHNPSCTPNLTELAKSVDDTLFQRIMHNPYHVLYHLFPGRRELVYNIRPRHHDRQLSIIFRQLRKRNFIYRMLFKDSYQLFLLLLLLACFYSYFYLYFNLVQIRSVILCNKRICMYDAVGKKLASGPGNAKYTSNDIQNELLGVMASMVQGSIAQDVRDSGEFAILADETKDCRHMEQMAVVL